MTAPPFLLIFALAVSLLDDARADQLPTETDLRAAYCIKVNQGTLDAIANYRPAQPVKPRLEEMVAKMNAETGAAARDRLHRLRSYLFPRVPSLELASIVAAMKRGEIDTARYFETSPDVWDKKATRCIRNCMEGDQLYARIAACKKINWLPF